MRYFVFIVAILAIVLPGWSGEETPEPQLPAAVERALDTYDAEVQKAQSDYRKEVDRAKAKAAKAIEREQERATKAGDLEGALAIKAKAEELDKHTAGGLAELDILGNKIKKERAAAQLREVQQAIVGRWEAVSGISGLKRTFTFRKDGTVSWERGNHKWSVKDGKVLVFDEGAPPTWVFELPVVEVKWGARHEKGTLWPFTKVKQ
jgi:hypothetical protein